MYFLQIRFGMAATSIGIRARLSIRPVSLIAITMLATFAMTGMTFADDDDDYFDCVLDKAQAIMKTQKHKDAAAALHKAYRICQPLESSKEAGVGSGVSLPEHAWRTIAPANS